MRGGRCFPVIESFGEWVAQSQLAIAADGTPDDKRFGFWIADNDLRQLAGDRPVEDHERAAAMWAAGNPEQFEEAKAAGNARTVRVSGFGTPTPPFKVLGRRVAQRIAGHRIAV